MKKRRMVLAGGSGFLGALLAQWFIAKGDDVVVLTRFPRDRHDGAREAGWDGKTLGEWVKYLDGADVLINLAGKSVNCRYHERNRRELIDSRVQSTRALGEAVSKCAQPPSVWLNASTATIYKHSLDRPMDETGEIGATLEAKDAFSIEIATAWEAAFNRAQTPLTRKVLLRSAMVFGEGSNSVFPVMRRMAQFGLAGAMAGGRQVVSWIHEEDFCRAIEWLIERNDLSGPVNIAAPNPVRNCDMMRILRRVCGVPIGLPAALWMLETGAWFLRTETELLIKSRNVLPGRLLVSGFQFHFAEMEKAIEELESRLGRNIQLTTDGHR